MKRCWGHSSPHKPLPALCASCLSLFSASSFASPDRFRFFRFLLSSGETTAEGFGYVGGFGSFDGMYDNFGSLKKVGVGGNEGEGESNSGDEPSSMPRASADDS